MDATTETRRSRTIRIRWLRYSLRGLLVLVLLVSIPMAWIANKVNALRPQLEAANRIVERGGAVRYEPAEPEWIGRIVGEENFRRVVEVEFGEIARYTIGHREGQQQIRDWFEEFLLRVRRSGNVQRAAQIEEDIANLDQPETGWSYRPSDEFSRDWRPPQITDAEFADIRHMDSLRKLTAWRADITADTLSNLHDLPQLEWLDLRFIPIDNHAAQQLGQLKNLRVLWLTRPGIDDEALVFFSELSGLEELHLRRNHAITDAGLEHLFGLARLRDLDLRETSVTAEGVKRLQAALPNAKIHR